MEPDLQNVESIRNEERRAEVAAFISNEMHVAAKYLWEQERLNGAISDFETRPYQQEAWECLWKAREDGKQEALLHLATGLGKTSIAVLDYAKFRAEMIEARPSQRSKVMFVVNQNNILEQASERFADFLPEISQSYFSSRNQQPKTELTLATYQTLVRSGNALSPDYFDYIIYDEAHHIEADTYKRVVEYFKPQFQIGMTATPERMDKRDITEHFGEAVYSKTLPEAIREDLLANVDYRVVLDSAVEDAIDSGFQPHSIRELKELFDTELRNYEIAEKIRDTQREIMAKEKTDSVKTIVFCESIEHADIMAEFVAGESYHWKRTEKEQAAVMDAFRKGGLKTIVVRDKFNEGVDVPDARLIVMIRSTQSKTIFEQQLGRGLRKTKDKSEVTNLDFVGNAERLVMLKELVENVFDEDVVGKALDEEHDQLSIRINENSFLFTEKALDVLKVYEQLHPDEANAKWRKVPNEEIVRIALEISPDKPLTGREIEQFDRHEFPRIWIIYRKFGSVRNFYEACGFEVIDWNAVTDQEIIDRALRISPDKPLDGDTIDALGADEFPTMYMIYKRFGTLKDFNALCGFEVKDWNTVSNQQIVDLALELSPSKPLTVRGIKNLSRNAFPSTFTIANRFGSLIEFQRQCGFDPSLDWSVFSDQELVDLALQISPHEPLTMTKLSKIQRTEFPSYDILKARFGSIKTFAKLCGFKVRPHWSKYTNEEIGKRALELVPNRPINWNDLSRLDNSDFPSITTIIKRFGSIENLNSMNGFDSKQSWEDMSNDDLIRLAKEISPNTPLTGERISKLERWKFPSREIIVEKFGSITAFKKACGYSLLERNFRWDQYSEEQLLRLADELSPGLYFGRTEILKLSREIFPSFSVIKRRFGSVKRFNELRGYYKR